MAADDTTYGFGADDVRRIGAAVSFVERDPRYTLSRRKYPVGGGGGMQVVEGRLTSAITPADNSRTDPTTFTFRKWTGDGEGELDEADSDETGYNRSTQLSVGSGGYVVCAKINGTWRPIAWDESCP